MTELEKRIADERREKESEKEALVTELMHKTKVSCNVVVALLDFLDFPRFNMSNYGRRAFSFAGPRTWNSLPEYFRQAPSLSVFKHSLKTYLFE